MSAFRKTGMSIMDRTNYTNIKGAGSTNGFRQAQGKGGIKPQKSLVRKPTLNSTASDFSHDTFKEQFQGRSRKDFINEANKIMRERMKNKGSTINSKSKFKSEVLMDNKEISLKNYLIGLLKEKRTDINEKERNIEKALKQSENQLDRDQFPKLTDAEFEQKVKSMSDEEKVQRLNTLWRSFVISDCFEPGSTYKVFTIAGALEDNVIDASETFYCDGHQFVADYDINCWNTGGHGTQTVSQALENSCNDCLMQIAEREGVETFDKYQVLFGFGQRTNVDLPGEQSESALASLVYHKENLNPVELATSSFGQGVTVTMIQLGTAFCSAINGGYYYQPHIVSRIVDENGNLVKNFDNILVKRTISESTSRTLREVLYKAVTDGTGTLAGVDGYSIGGKTGTAEKLPRGTDKYVLSFIGFAPAEDPQVVIYCVVDEPHVEAQAYSGAGAVMFNMIAEDLFPYMNIYKTGDDYVPDFDKTETATPIYNGDIPENDVAGGGVNQYETIGETSTTDVGGDDEEADNTDDET